MINSFKDKECRDSGIIYNSTFEQIKKLYEINPQQAGELAISAIELVLTGSISSDDAYVGLMLENMKAINQKAKNRYEAIQKSKKLEKKEELNLEFIAAMLKQKYTQKQIAEAVGVSQQAISKRVATIRTDYPELLN